MPQYNTYSSPSLLDIYVLASRNNGIFLNNAITSICSQIDGLPIKVIASLNGDARLIETEIKPQQGLLIRTREQYLPAEAHIHKCINECTSEYIMLFHDDDVLADGHLRRAVGIIRQEMPDLILTDSVFFCDGHPKIKGGQPTKITRKTRTEMILLALGGENINFASCIYRTSNARSINIFDLANTYGKYADRPTMLCSVSNGSRIIFCQGSTVFTRVHSSQDSQQHDPNGALHRARLLQFYREQIERPSLSFLLCWPYACLRALLGEVSISKVLLMSASPFRGWKFFALAPCVLIGASKLLIEKVREIMARLLRSTRKASAL